MNKIIVTFLVIILLSVGVSLLIPDVRRALVQLAVVSGILQVAGQPPRVEIIWFNTTPTTYTELSLTAPPGPGMNGLDDRNVTIRFNATIYDVNGDCDLANSVKIYICTNDTGASCTSGTSGVYVITMTYISKSADTYYCNYSTVNTFFPLSYYRWFGNSRVNVSVFDKDNLFNSSIGYWYYNPFIGFRYPYPTGSTIDLGTINVGPWNDNAGANTTKNTGNIRLNLTWNATDFQCPTCVPLTPIDINGTNFIVDDDPTNDLCTAGDSACIPDLSTNKVSFFPSGGMRRCGNWICSQDENFVPSPSGANYTTDYHIATTPPKTSGTYTNTIQITECQCVLACPC